MKLDGKAALVTGGAVRIGRAICHALAAEGCRVVVHFRHSGDQARRLVAELGGAPRAVAVRSALGSEAQCERLIESAARAVGGLDILVNNAAVFHKDTLRAASRVTFLAEFSPNVLAPLSLIRAFARRSGGGCVVNLLDRRVACNEAGCLPYMISKKALADLTRLAALELAPGIRVNGVAPGAVLPPPGKGRSYLKDAAGKVPLRLQVTPEDVAAAVVFLASAPAVTGEIVFVDGGQHLLGTGV